MSKGSTPATPSLANDIRDVTNAMPQLYGMSAQYNPLFSSLNLSGLDAALFGTEAGSSSVPMEAGWYDATGKLVTANPNAFTNGPAAAPTNHQQHGLFNSTGQGGGRNNGFQGPPPAGVSWRPSGSYTANTPAQRGLISMYGSALPALRTANSEANPQMYSLLGNLNTQALNDLALGNQLSPDQMRLMQQTSRAGDAARGLGFGPADVYRETMMQQGYGDQLQQQRRQFAAQMFGLDQGQQQSEASQAMNLLGQNANGVTNSNPMAGMLGYAHDNSMTGYNGATSMSAANAQGTNAIIGGTIGAVGLAI